MNKNTILTVFAAALISISASAISGYDVSTGVSGDDVRGMREALKLHDRGLESRSGSMFRTIAGRSGKVDPEGYAILNDVVMMIPGYEIAMERFLEENSHSIMVPQIVYAHALNCFDAQEYAEASQYLGRLAASDLYKKQVDEFLFRKAYSALENRNMEDALNGFIALERRPVTDFTAPARYAIGYVNYENKNFRDALEWFEKASTDSRFAEIANYYIMECRFMLKDYKYVAANGDAMYEAVPEDRKSHIARIISEACLVLGDADNAKRYYELGMSEGKAPDSRTDWFYSGSVLYAVDDYEGAIRSFNNMTERMDSLGQVANYHLGYSYIQTRNKVAALEAFKDAAQVWYDPQIAEDAYFNWAKLAFDINSDTSVFNDYIKKYPAKEQSDRINNYIAVAALYDRDYATAIEAYDRIDELDEDMVLNYMKANYLRANQLIQSGSYRKAVPCLKAAAYYSDKGTRFNQLSRYWLAESYYRNDQFGDARDVFSSLYNSSALFGLPESYLLSYNIAYCYYKEGNYQSALRWFTEYLGEKNVKFRKEALERKGDCLFMAKDYAAAAREYDKVLKDYFNVNDIYPYYQSALSYGLNNNADKKMSLLSNVLKASPKSRFYAEALFELGRTYALHDKDEDAMKCFRQLVDQVQDNTFLARSYIEMGTISRNQSQFNEALEHYKKVVEDLPLSGFAEDALLAIESIYQTRNQPEEYIAYIEKIGRGTMKTEDEKESMIFNSAEQIFLSADYEKALVSLQSYIQKYPEGAFVSRTEFYIAESYRYLGKLEQACDMYRKVIGSGDESLTELSMLSFSDLSFKLEKWSDAFGGYTSLYESAKLDNNKYLALLGMMRSAYRAHDWEQALKHAKKVVSDQRTDAAKKAEADYIMAKSYLASSRREQAFEILERLAKDVSGPYGAEAAYLVILDCYDRGDFDNVETKVYAFADTPSEQTYWLAKSFIVLGDSFVERGEVEQAKATFESVRDGYTPSGKNDDVMDNVNMRLKKLENL